MNCCKITEGHQRTIRRLGVSSLSIRNHSGIYQWFQIDQMKSNKTMDCVRYFRKRSEQAERHRVLVHNVNASYHFMANVITYRGCIQRFPSNRSLCRQMLDDVRFMSNRDIFIVRKNAVEGSPKQLGRSCEWIPAKWVFWFINEKNHSTTRKIFFSLKFWMVILFP